MQDINEKSHYSSVISSINKEYINARLGKTMNPNDIYLLDIVYNLLYSSIIPLTSNEIKQLLNLYKNILYKSKNICNTNIADKYQVSKQNNMIQAEKTDCNNITVYDRIYYWQEESYSTTINDIRPLTYGVDYFTLKPSDSYSNLENIGRTINYTNVGRIAFYATNSNDKKFVITDLLNNDVTDIFDIEYLVDSNATLFVSKGIYSFSDIFFKFKKTNISNEDIGIFSNEFNDTFS